MASGQFSSAGAALQHLTPRPVKDLYGSNYLSIAGNDYNFAKQFLPEVYEKEVERYGNRTISGFLKMVGAEMPMASDEIVWSEQGRLHVAYDSVKVKTNNDATDHTLVVLDSGGSAQAHAIRANQTIIVSKGFVTVKAFVTSVDAATGELEAYPLTQADWPASFVAATNPTDLKVFVYGSEFGKGTNGMAESIDAEIGRAHV